MLHPWFYGPVNHCETDLEQNQSQDVKDSSFSKNTQKIVRWFQKTFAVSGQKTCVSLPLKTSVLATSIHSALGLGKWYRSGERKYHSHAPGCPCKKGSNFQGSNVHLHQHKSNSFYFKWQWLTKFKSDHTCVHRKIHDVQYSKYIYIGWRFNLGYIYICKHIIANMYNL